jgi:hypothetical protein
MRDQLVGLVEGAGIEEQIDPLAGGQLARLVLAAKAILAARPVPRAVPVPRVA